MKFEIVLSDFPWSFNDRRVVRKDGGHPKYGFGADGNYLGGTMKPADIYAVPINEIMERNSVHFCWATPANLSMAFKAFDHWKQVYKTYGFEWVKVNKKDFRPWFGVGYYSKSNSEPNIMLVPEEADSEWIEYCLMLINGRLKPVTNSLSNLVIQPHVLYDDPTHPDILSGRKKLGDKWHSAKPPLVRDLIVELFGKDKRRIELFARWKRAKGWYATGLEMDGLKINDAIKFYKNLPDIMTPKEALKKAKQHALQLYPPKMCIRMPDR